MTVMMRAMCWKMLLDKKIVKAFIQNFHCDEVVDLLCKANSL